MIDSRTASLLNLVLREWGPGGYLCWEAGGEIVGASEDFARWLGLIEPPSLGAPIARFWERLSRRCASDPEELRQALATLDHLDLRVREDGQPLERRIRLSLRTLCEPDIRHVLLVRDLSGSLAAELATRANDARISMVPPRDTLGEVRLCLAFEDVRERLTTEAELKCYRDMVEASSDALVFIDRALRYRVVNVAYARLWRRSAKAVLGKRVEDVVGRELFETKLKARLQRCLDGGCEALSFVDEILVAPGVAKHMESTYTPHRGDEGAVIGILVTIRDVTERVAAELAVRDSEQRARALLDAMPDLMFRLDRAGVYLDYKANREELMVQDTDLIGQRVRDITPTAFADLIEDKIAATLASSGFQEFEYALEIPGRGRREWEARMVRSGAGEVIATVRDITDRKAAAARLHTLSFVVEQSREAILLTDVAFRVTYLNAAFQTMFGWSLDELRGQRPDRLNAEPDSVAHQTNLYRRLESGQEVFSEAINRRKDGSLFHCQFWVSPLRDEEGRLVGYMGSQRDVSEPRRLRQALIQTQKMEAIGRLTGGIAHDFNNILGSVLGFAELARRRHGGADAKLDAYLEQIDIAGTRARDLVRQLLIFSRGDRTAKARPLPLAPMVEEVMRMLRPILPANLDIRLKLPDTPLRVRVDPPHFQQILMNLALNARDAMPEGGVLGVTLRASRLDDGLECLVCAEPVDGDWVELIVSDTGGGIPSEHLDLVFQPFFTTKAVGDGSGMGLAVVAGLTRTYEGHVLVRSRLGQGSAFHLLLPPVDPMTGTDTE
ncbi:PAS domain-containing sensor histidine kinase [Thiocystis violacea]|uniref:PAS domain-containing sensor histidine kinase n=1 Tax=Thiocystis violacea TaxID=13725 RepID=UPI0019041529|nr:PAS domain-containing protein [Thiocystis violacea]MBK1717884.1 hypothetical protein [Thiocystis violacea]